MSAGNNSWIYELNSAEIRGGAKEPADLPSEVALAWDLTAAGFVCRIGRRVLQLHDHGESANKLGSTATHFLGDRAIENALAEWEGPIYLGPSAIPCHDGTLRVLAAQPGNAGRTFQSLGLWVPQGSFTKEGEWEPDTSVKIDPSVIAAEPIVW